MLSDTIKQTRVTKKQPYSFSLYNLKCFVRKVRAIKGFSNMACGCRSQATVPGAGSADAERDHLQRGHYLQVGGVMSFDRGEVRYIFPQLGSE